MSALFVFQQRVYWDNTDGGGVVYHAQYLNLFERARSEWLRAHGIEQSALQQEQGLVFAIRRMAVEWLAPARLDDLLDISVSGVSAGGARLSFKQEMRRHGDGQLLAEASVTAVCLDFATFKPKKMPERIRAELTNVE